MVSARDFLGQTVTVHMDRPLGSCHPRHGYVYPVNYGFVPGTRAPDGGELDAYVLGADEPLTEFTGRCLAVIHRIDDKDDKLIVACADETYPDEHIRALTVSGTLFHLHYPAREQDAKSGSGRVIGNAFCVGAV